MHLLELQVDADILVEVDGRYQSLMGSEAIDLPDDVVHIITASDPMSQPASPEQNTAANERLRARLQSRDVKVLPALGYKGSWSEDSFAVSGLTREEALALAADYRQHSIFELDDAELRVIRVSDGAVAQRPRRSPTA